MVIGKIRRFMRGRRGQGMTEYIIIVALIAIAAITIFGLFGDQIKTVITDIANALGGGTAVTTEDTISVDDKTMKDFAEER